MSQIHSTSVIELTLPIALYHAFHSFFGFLFLFPSPMYSGLGGAGKRRQWLYAATRQCALWLVFRRSEAQQMLTMRKLACSK